MRILDLIHDRHILQLDIQELVHAFEGTADGDVIFELDGDLCVDEGFEEAESERRSVIIHRFGGRSCVWNISKLSQSLEKITRSAYLKKSILKRVER
jgi:hypothetical protein